MAAGDRGRDEDTSLLGYAGQKHTQQRQYQRSDQIEEWLRDCAGLLADETVDGYAEVARMLRDDILPGLRAYCNKPLLSYDQRVDPEDTNNDFHYHTVDQFQEAPDAFVQALAARRGAAEQTAPVLGQTAGRRAARRVVRETLESATAIAEHVDIVQPEFLGEVPAVGFTTQVGVHRQAEGMDIGNPVKLVSRQSGALKTLFSGGTGQGKSVSLETEAFDYYATSHDDTARDYKIIDTAGFRDGENWMYDIPQQQAPLRDRRSDMDLAETTADLDVDPELEILVPLTDDLEDQPLPYDTDRDRFTVQPFTVPASEIRKPLLVSMITAKLTPEQESIVRDAYDEVNNRERDWVLKDLADEIKSRPELSPSKQKPAIRTLRQLQQQGFIRSASSDYNIDWRDLFEAKDTITVFSQAFLEDQIAKLICFGYLTHTIVKERERMYGVPDCVMLMRELWKVAPHNRRQAFDARAAQLQEAIGQMLAELFRENRHSGVHVLADTQQPSDLLKPVREMFNRYVIFRTDKATVDRIFEWTSNDKNRAFYGTLTPKPGEASVVGMLEPAIEQRRIEFAGPIRYAPPPHHHFDEEADHNGWRTRDRHVDHEELRAPGETGAGWPYAPSARLAIGFEGEDRDDGLDPSIEPVAAFVRDCLKESRFNRTKKQVVRQVFNAYIRDHDAIDHRGWDLDDSGVKVRFGRQIKTATDWDLDRTQKDGSEAYKHVGFTATGSQFLSDVMDGLEDASEPVTDR